MNPILTNPDFTKEFVITPEPNAYLVGLKVSPEEAAPFEGHDFLCICLLVDPEGGGAGVAYVYDVLPDGDVGNFRVNNDEINEAQGEVLMGLEERCFTAVQEFFNAVEGDLDEFYSEIELKRVLYSLLDGAEA